MKEGYFPPNTFHRDLRIDTMTANWFSQHLDAMEEPSLWESSDDTTLHAYRFLYLRTRHPPIAVRLLIEEAKIFTLKRMRGYVDIKMTDGAGGYEPGKLVVEEEILLIQKEVQAVLSQLDALQFWQLPTSEETLGQDGAQWILEGLHQGRYHVVERWSPDDGPFKQMGLLFLSLSDQDIRPIY